MLSLEKYRGGVNIAPLDFLNFSTTTSCSIHIYQLVASFGKPQNLGNWDRLPGERDPGEELALDVKSDIGRGGGSLGGISSAS